jgi:dipeptidase
MMAAGKKATEDGSVLVGRSPDALGDYAQQILAVPRKKHSPEEVLLFDKSEGVKIPQAPVTYAYIGIMGVLEGEDVNTADGGINEFQVSAGASTGGLLNKKAQEVIPRMSKSIGDYRCTLVLERCKTAREGIKYVGELTEKYGARTDNYIIADPNEVWFYEEYRGNLWAAVRVPDECFVVQANTVRIGEVDLNDSKNFMGSKNILSFAIDNDLYDPDAGEPFHLAKVYGAQTGKVRHRIPAPEYDRRRIWRSISYFAPSTNLDPEASWDPSYFPLFVKPDKKLTPKDFLSLFTDHYQGTKYDHYDMNEDKYQSTGHAFTAEPRTDTPAGPLLHINKNRQYQLAPIWGTERLIGTTRAVTTYCVQLRSWMPNEVGGLLWAGLSEGATSGRIPWYSGITRTPKPYTIGIQEEGPVASAPFKGSHYDKDSAYWIFRELSNLVNLFYHATQGEVIPIWREWEEKLYKLQPSIEKVALELHDKDPELAAEFLTTYSCAMANEALDMAKDMIPRVHTILAHYCAPL